VREGVFSPVNHFPFLNLIMFNLSIKLKLA
jgi:hypothetical protein